MPIPIRVLIVEDSPDDAELMLGNLADHGFAPQAERVETEADYLAGLNAAPDVILSDFRLPQFSGPRALELLNERRLDIPFIALSSAVGDEEAAGLIKLGASDFLLKDRMARLGSAVTQALKLKDTRDERRRLEAALAESEEKFRLICETAIDAVVLLDDDNRIQYANPAIGDVFGYAPHEVEGKPIAILQPARLRERHEQGVKRFLETGAKTRNWGPIERFGLHRDGREFPVEISYSHMIIHGKPGFVGVIRDITERKNQERKIARLSRIHAVMSGINSLIVRVRDRQELFDGACRIAVEQGGFGIAWIGTLDPDTLDVNLVAWAGIGHESFPHIPSSAHNDVQEGQSVISRAIRGKQPVIVNDLAADSASQEHGGPRIKEAFRRGYRSLAVFPLLIDDSAVGVLALFVQEAEFFTENEQKLLTELANDISFALQSMARQEKLDYLAYYDVLTGLPNRALFDDRMMQCLRIASHEKNKVALVLIDIERFRVIKDTLGRSAADGLLKLVAQRLQCVIFDRDSLARIHADVFAGLFPDIKDEADIARIVEEKIMGCLIQPLTIAGRELRVSAKVGVAMFPSNATEPDALFSSAAAALRQAKNSSDRYLFYAHQMNARVAERLMLENKLRRALEWGQFVLFYQPKVDLHNGRVVGLEALIRWNDPDSGLVAPALFIPLLEETGMIVEVGAWAMKRAVMQYAAWRATGLQPPHIAVNVSEVQLKRKDFVAMVQQAIVVDANPDHGLDLEITESMIMEEIETNIEKLKLLRNLGIGIAIDDFGTGYSSLRYLTRLPITALKIDGGFVRHLTTNQDDVAIVSTIIALARILKLKVIAEGVETEEQLRFLRLLKCDEFQGYLFSKPVPAEQVPALLARGGKRAARTPDVVPAIVQIL